MPLQITPRRIRILVNTAGFDAPQDKLTKSTITMWNGSPTRIDVALGYGPAQSTPLVDDLSNLNDLTLQIGTPGSNNAAPAEDAIPLLSKTISVFDPTVTAETWADDSKQHGSFFLTGAEAKLGVGNKWFVLVASIDGVADPVTLAAGTLTIKGDGYGNGVGAPPDPPASYLNSEQSDARYARPGVSGPDFRADLDSLTGGGATALDSVATLAINAGYLIALEVTGQGLKHYRLRAGTTAEAAPGIIRPDDFHADTNAKYWEAV